MTESRGKVPFVDLRLQLQELRGDLDAALARVIESGRFILGPELDAFEREFAAFCGVRFAVGVGSGTDALGLTLRAYGVGEGDEVVTVSHTFVATAFAITATGATPCFVDIEPGSLSVDPNLVEAAITPRTRAIVPVHIYGQCADMDAVNSLAAAHDLPVIEDAAQAVGAVYKGRKAGSLGNAGCFSFYPSKNLGALGDGGAVVTDDEELARRIAKLRNYSRIRQYEHEALGFNSRLDELQAACLRVKLGYVAQWNDARRKHASAYQQLLEDAHVALPIWSGGNDHVFHLYVVRSVMRDKLQIGLADEGIETLVHYPVPVHRQAPYSHTRRSLPVTERAAAEVVSLPMYPDLTSTQLERVSAAVATVLQGQH